ncbi:peptide chain release factor 2 [Patescibacteria group bacterium]|nr:MAG: peptide chain release factor 2 [Patescibacteria group bacterium]
MQSIVKQFVELQLLVEEAMRRLGLEAEQGRLEELDAQMQAPGFWDDSQAAAAISQQAAGLRSHLEEWVGLHKDVMVAKELAELGDESMAGDLQANLERLQQAFAAKEFELKLSGTYDRNNAIISIFAGAGGTDAQDWAEMLLRMYLRYFEKAGWKAEVVERSDGEEAGIKSVTVEVNGQYAYGKLKGESGVHRLVRQSPFNADAKRQTSFARVEVLPQLDRPEEFELDEQDLRVDVYRSGGHGGQSVNTTDSAVRITHIPTGTVVAIQNERSQLQNKEKALAILKARLTALMLQQQKTELGELRGENQEAAWGNQIRNYVLHPYTKVKDERTKHETSQAGAVLDGDLDPFIEAYLSSRVGQ